MAETNNRRQRESYVAAYFRDPIGIEGATIETFGLDAVAVPYDEPPPDEPQAPECTSGDEDDAGHVAIRRGDFLRARSAERRPGRSSSRAPAALAAK